jgi:hypothetical protein
LCGFIASGKMRPMVRSLLCVSAICGVLSAVADAQQIISVPQGSAVMVDGKLSPGEWTDAEQTGLTNGIVVYAKQHEHFLLLAVVFPPGKHGFSDLFINDDLDLHASAKLGERYRNADGTWPEWTWWNNDRWTANVSRVEEFAGPKLMPENVREYQIDLARFPNMEIRLEVLSTVLSSGQVQEEWRSSPLLLRMTQH